MSTHSGGFPFRAQGFHKRNDALIKKDSYTAKQLLSITPENMYYSTRGSLLGPLQPNIVRKSHRLFKLWKKRNKEKSKQKQSHAASINSEFTATYVRFRLGRLRSLSPLHRKTPKRRFQKQTKTLPAVSIQEPTDQMTRDRAHTDLMARDQDSSGSSASLIKGQFVSEPSTASQTFVTARSHFDTESVETLRPRGSGVQQDILDQDQGHLDQDQGYLDQDQDHLDQDQDPFELPNPFDTQTESQRSQPRRRKRDNARDYLRHILDNPGVRFRERVPDLRFYKKQRGEVLFCRRMLVQPRVTTRDPQGHSINEYTCPNSYALASWREFTVVARYTGKTAAPVALYLYTTHVIEKVQRTLDRRWSYHVKYRILLDAHSKASIFSPLEFSVALWNVNNKSSSGGTNFMLFKCQSLATSYRWLDFIMTNLVSSKALQTVHTIHVRVPTMGLDVQIPHAKCVEWFSRSTENPQNNILYSETQEKHASVSYVAQMMIKNVLEASKSVECIRKTKSDIFESDIKVGVALRRYNRLEWLASSSDSSLVSAWSTIQFYDIELRTKVATSTRVIVENEGQDKYEMEEPGSVEGFGWTFTSSGVRWYKVSKRVYFHSHDQYLCFSAAANARLPVILPQERDFDLDLNDIQALRESIQELPDVLRIEPYPLDDTKNIAWIKDCKTIEDYERYDQEAAFERDRRADLLAGCEQMIDLAKVTGIKALSNPNMLQIKSNDKVVAILRVSSSSVRDLWVDKLNQLSTYWRAFRKMELRRRLFFENSGTEQVPEFDHKGSLANTESYSGTGIVDEIAYGQICVLQNRSVLFHGYVYCKSSIFSRPKKRFLVLTRGSLIVFDLPPDDDENDYGTAYKRWQNISLSSSYIYSGRMAADDLLRRDHSLDAVGIDGNALPRMYRDGVSCQDSEFERCFVLWTGKRKGLKKSLSATGSIYVFLTRSKYERDLWVTHLQHSIGSVAGDESLIV